MAVYPKTLCAWFFCIFHFCHTCSLCRVELVVRFHARGSTQLWLWHFLYSAGPHPVSNLYIYSFVVSLAFMAGAASQAGDTDSYRAPGLTSGLQGSVIVHRGTLLLVPQWQCIGSFVFYIVLASSWICMKKHWPRCVKISCQKISPPKKSPTGWPLTFLPKVWV